MSRREDIDNTIWVDPEFAPLTPDAKLLYLWSFTNPYCNMSGLYKIAPAALGFGTGLDPTRIRAALRELCDGGFLFYVDCILWVRSRVKHLRSRSPQMAKSIANDLLRVGSDQELRVRFQREYGSHAWLREELSRTYLDPIHTLSEKPVDKPDSDTLSRPSGEGPGQGQGQGLSSSSSSTREVHGEAKAEGNDSLTEARELFAYWQEKCGHPNAKPSQERLGKIRARLKDGHTPADIRSAIDGAAAGAFVNDSGRRFDDIELICRSSSKLESFIGRSGDRVEPVNPALPEWQRPRPEWLEQVKARLEAQEA